MSASPAEPTLPSAAPGDARGAAPVTDDRAVAKNRDGKDRGGKGQGGKDRGGKKPGREAKRGAAVGARIGDPPEPAGEVGPSRERPAPETRKPAAPLPKPPAARSVGWALVQAARLHRARIGDRLAALDLFAGQEQVVQALAAAGSMTMGDLAATLRVRPPTASKTITRLAALGVVERRAVAGDGRVVRVHLTEAGLAKAEAIQRIWDEVETELIADLDGKEPRRLRKLLRKAAASLADAAGMAGHEADADIEDAGPDPAADPAADPAE